MNIIDKISDELDRHEKKYKFASLVVCGGNSVLNIFKGLSLKEINCINRNCTIPNDGIMCDFTWGDPKKQNNLVTTDN